MKRSAKILGSIIAVLLITAICGYLFISATIAPAHARLVEQRRIELEKVRAHQVELDEKVAYCTKFLAEPGGLYLLKLGSSRSQLCGDEKGRQAEQDLALRAAQLAQQKAQQLSLLDQTLLWWAERQQLAARNAESVISEPSK